MRLGKNYPLFHNPLFSPNAAINGEAPRRVILNFDAEFLFTPASTPAVVISDEGAIEPSARRSIIWTGSTTAGIRPVHFTVEQKVFQDRDICTWWRLDVVDDLTGAPFHVTRWKHSSGWTWTQAMRNQSPFDDQAIFPPWTDVIEWRVGALYYGLLPPPWPA